MDEFTAKLTSIFDFVAQILSYVWDFFKKLIPQKDDQATE